VRGGCEGGASQAVFQGMEVVRGVLRCLGVHTPRQKVRELLVDLRNTTAPHTHMRRAICLRMCASGTLWLFWLLGGCMHVPSQLLVGRYQTAQ
jgi:hypothetical protein